ncbi:MAG: hypothetical protein QXN05_00350 [Acidilobaceae archaeon]
MSSFKTLREVFLEVLELKGIHDVGVRLVSNQNVLFKYGFQKVALEVLLNDAVLCYESVLGEVLRTESLSQQTFRIVVPPGQVKADVALVRRHKCLEKIVISREALAKLTSQEVRPFFIVDLGALKGRESLELRDFFFEGVDLDVDIATAIEYIRRYVWDENLVITSSIPKLLEALEKSVGHNRVILTSRSSAEFLWSRGIDRVAVITKTASKALTPEEVYSYDAYVLPVAHNEDDFRSRSFLESLVPWGKLRRIELKGSNVGVPTRPSRLLCVLLKAIYEFRGDVDKAVISCMSFRDMRRRLLKELEVRAKRSLMGSYVTLEDYSEISSWLPISLQEFRRACELLGLKIRN